MPTLEEKIAYEIDWRTAEISITKSLPFLFPFSHEQSEILRKYAVPTFYSLWEGFVVECFSIYIREINDLKLTREQIHFNILTHSIDALCQLNNARIEFPKQVSLIKKICDHIDKEIVIPVGIPTESNIKYKVINAIFHRFNLNPFPSDPYEKRLNKLLLVRNGIAHGQNSIPITSELLEETSETVILCMHSTAERILEGYANAAYLGS